VRGAGAERRALYAAARPRLDCCPNYGGREVTIQNLPARRQSALCDAGEHEEGAGAATPTATRRNTHQERVSWRWLLQPTGTWDARNKAPGRGIGARVQAGNFVAIPRPAVRTENTCR
jgi:hypothetical protein